MIHPNLHSLIQFVDSDLRDLATEVEKAWATQERVRCNPTIRQTEKLLDPNLDKEYRIRTKKLMQFSCKERLYFYKLIRIMKIAFPEYTIFNFIYADLTSTKRILRDNLEYLYLESLTDNQFCYEIDTFIMKKKHVWYGRWYQMYSKPGIQKEKFSIYTVFFKVFVPTLVFIPKKEPKRYQRKRGYRDHGSLGSDFSRTLRDQSSDWTILQKEEEKKNLMKDYLSFLSGLGGWE